MGLELSPEGDFINLNDADAKIPSDMRGFIEGENQMRLAAQR